MDEKGQEAIAIHWRLEQWFTDLEKETIQKLKLFHEQLLKANKSINLISSKTISSADQLHFADAIMASRIIYKDMPTKDLIYDFGSGGGFPGVVFALLFPKLKVVLVESDLRKVEFLKGVLFSLRIENVDILSQSIESLPENSVVMAMVRGLSTISRTILMARKIFLKGGYLYHLKSEEWGLEVSEIPTQLCSVWAPALTADYRLPLSGVKFSIIRTEKIG